jgi:hypothetical protein
MFCKYRNVRKTEPFPGRVSWNLRPFQIAKLTSLVSFKRPSGISLNYYGGETPTGLDTVDQARHSFAYEKINNLIVV